MSVESKAWHKRKSHARLPRRTQQHQSTRPDLASCYKLTATEQIGLRDLESFFRRLRLHVVLALLLVEFSLFLRRRVLVPLVLRDKVIHVALRFGEFHLNIPSPVYQCRNALRRNIPVNCSATRLNISWIAVELPRKATAIFSPLGGPC